MKKIILLIVSVILAVPLFADTVIQMEPYGGVYRVPCLVNGAKMKFIFDTGASNVCLSLPMAEYLYDNGYITDKDILGTGSATVADGRIVDHIRINLKEIQIGDKVLTNVETVVVNGQSALRNIFQAGVMSTTNNHFHICHHPVNQSIQPTLKL